MTNIAILGGDFEILFDDETVGGAAVAGMRMVRRTSGAGSTVYSSNALYSAVADEADAFEAMGFTNPMLPTTPNAYTMENQYFIPRSSTEFLKAGTITCDWTNIALPDTNGNGVIRKPYTDSTPFVDGDIGRQVTASASTDTGTLLDFEVEPDGTLILWIRPDVSGAGGDEFDDTTGTISVTGDGGTGSGAPITGETDGVTKYTAIQAIGSVPTATEVYVVQDRIKLANAADAAGFQFWITDPTVSLGIISVLLRTRTQDVDIADEDLEVFARRYTSLYDNFRLNVAAGGFSALPLASAPDINNTTGYQAFTGNTGTGTFTVGEIANEAVSLASVVITAVGGTAADPELEYYIVGDVTIDIFDSGAQVLTGVDSGAFCTTAAPTANVGGPTETGAGNGGTVTITIGEALADHDGSGITEPYSVTVDAQGPGGNGVAVADVYERIKFVTRRGQDNTFWDTVACSVPGEQYHGLEAQVFTDGEVGTFSEGDDITGQLGFTARVLGSNATAAGEGTVQNYITVTDQQTSLDGMVDDDVLTDTIGGDTVVVDTSAGAGGAIQSFPSSNKASPFGTFTGTQLFGSRGILFTGQHDDDGQAYTLIDDNGNQRVSPNTVSFVVANTAEFDRVLVARDTGVDSIIDKDQFGGMTVQAISLTTITVAGSIDTEVPPSGFVRVVAVDEQEEHKYEYDSRVSGAGGVFTLHPVTPGTTTAGTTDILLEDSGADFVTDVVTVGMLIHFATVGSSTYEVVSVTDLNTLVISLVYGAGGLADNGEAYTINETIQAYDTSDDLYDLILDTEAVGVTTSNTFVQSTVFDTVVNVRQGKIILPFTQNAEVTASGGGVTVVRQTDTIAT
jgi:hypothetical protein